MAIIVPSRRIWTRQPQYPAGVDWGNPLTQGIHRLWTPTYAPGLTLGPGPQKAATLSGDRAASSAGVGWKASSGNPITWATVSAWTTTAKTDGTGDFTIFALGNPISQASRDALISQDEFGGVQTYLIANCSTGYAASAGNLFFGAYNGGSGLGVGASGVIDGKFHLFVGTRAGNVSSIYVDGRLINTNSGTVAAVYGAAAAIQAGIGCLATYSGYESPATHVLGGGWNRALSASEVAELSENPWQLFAPANSPIFYSLPAAGGGTTYNDEIADSVASTDTPVDNIVAAESLTESGALTDTPVDSIVATETITESGALSDTPVDNIVATETITESGALTEEAVAGAQQEDVTDSGALTDTPSDNIVASESVVDSISVTETVIESLSVVNEDITETGTVTDAVSESGGEGEVSQTKGGNAKAKIRKKKKKEPEVDTTLEAIILSLEEEKKQNKEAKKVVEEVKKVIEKAQEVVEQKKDNKEEDPPESLESVALAMTNVHLEQLGKALKGITSRMDAQDAKINKLLKKLDNLEEVLIILNN